MKRMSMSLPVAAVLSLAVPEFVVAQPVDISATANCDLTGEHGVPVALAAGRYIMRPVSRLYTAWNAWGGRVSGCDSGGANCAEGWIVQWSVVLGDDAPLDFPGKFTVWQTPELALAHAASFVLTLDAPQTVLFAVRDIPCTDNAGGVSLDLVHCTADFNSDGTVNSTDVSDFINQWFADQVEGTLVTDWDGNGVVNSTDVSAFINDWFSDQANGCG